MTKYLTLLLSIGLAYWGCDNNEGCIDASKISDASICTEEAQPVCGCNGVTYSNKCVAKSFGVNDWTLGKC